MLFLYFFFLSVTYDLLTAFPFPTMHFHKQLFECDMLTLNCKASPQSMTTNMLWRPWLLNPDLSINSKHANPSVPKPHYWQWKRHQGRKVWHMTCIRMGMFLIMREEECAKWKDGCCTSKRVILRGNVGVKGKVIPCMLNLIKYVAQRKCALFYSLARPPLAANQVMPTFCTFRSKILMER